MENLSKENDADWLYVNKLVHDRGIKLFEPKQLIVTFDKAKELLKFCQNRYTNLNGDTISFNYSRPTEYCNPHKIKLNYMTKELPPNEKCGDYFRIYGEKEFNPRTHTQDFSIFEVMYYISVELGLQNEFEYSNEFIDKILTFDIK